MVSMDQVHLEGNDTSGLILLAAVGGSVNAAVRNSSASGNGLGVAAAGRGGGAALTAVESRVITDDCNGIVTVTTNSAGTEAASSSNCTITHTSGAGFDMEGNGIICSRGNNTIGGNGPNTGSLTPISGQ